MPGSETVGREETPGVLIVRVRDDLDFGAFVTVYRSKTNALTWCYVPLSIILLL